MDYEDALQKLLEFLDGKSPLYRRGVYFDRIWFGDQIWVVCRSNGVVFDLSGKVKIKPTLNDPLSWLAIK